VDRSRPYRVGVFAAAFLLALATAGFGTAALPSQAPTITAVSPMSGAVGAVVTIVGTNFAGAIVTFGQVEAQGVEVDAGASEIFATVPAGATTGPITVATGAGSVTTSGDFTVSETSTAGIPHGLVPPSVSSFTPVSGKPGALIRISGANFAVVTGVMFGGVRAKFFDALSLTNLTSLVPVGAKSGKISVITTGGTGNSSASFTVHKTVMNPKKKKK